MPPNNLLLDIGARDFVCRSCLSALRRTAPARWGIRRSSQAAPADGKPRTHRAPRPSAAAPNDAERRQALKTLGLLKEDAEKEHTINYFDQDKNGKTRRLENAQEFAEALNGPDFDVEAHIGQLQQAIRQVGVAAIGGEENAAQLRKFREEYYAENNKDLSVADEPEDESDNESLIIPVESLVGVKRVVVTRLNTTIQYVARLLDRQMPLRPDTWALVWRDYSKARFALYAASWKIVPKGAWDVLWDTLAYDHPKNGNRMTHISVLAKDMDFGGVEMSAKKQMFTIEARFLDGHADEAVNNHRRLVATLGENPETFVDFWTLGMRMHCHRGDTERAGRMVNILLDSPHEFDARHLFPFVKACAEKSETVELAYSTYRRIRSMLGSSMVIEDYDKIISYFLVANQTERALWIFVAMMTAGRIELREGGELPLAIANPFFMGKWIKRLVLLEDLDGAHSVLLLMMDRKITPRPILANALIGALLRSQVADNVQKAEDIGWAMINARIQFVRNRARGAGLESPILLRTHGKGWPRANLETMSLFAENYQERGLHGRLHDVWKALKEAELAPNCFFLNQILFSRLQEGKGEEVAEICRVITTDYHIEPDSHTFMALWKALPINRLHRIAPKDVPEQVANTRRLFAEMVGYASVFEGGIHPDLSRKIMHSFRRLDDKVGMLVAYRALRHVFNMSDAQPMVIEIMVGAMNLEKHVLVPRNRQKVLLASQQVDLYLDFRTKEAIKKGRIAEGETLPRDVEMRERANYLELWLQTTISDMPNVEMLFQAAARDMGVYNAGEG